MICSSLAKAITARSSPMKEVREKLEFISGYPEIMELQ